MAGDLKPCPFCGGKFKMGQEPHDNHPVEGKFYIFHSRETEAARDCPIEVQGHFDSAEDAAAFWNRRAPADLSAAEAAAARGAVEKCVDVLRGYAEFDQRLCCDGRECGCQGATVFQEMEHYIRKNGAPAPGALERYVAGKVAEEREAICALLATHVYSTGGEGSYLRPEPNAVHDVHHQTIIAAIRARGAEARQAGEVGNE